MSDSEAAVVCHHCANLGYPILLAVSDSKSGWQFLCNSGEVETTEMAQIWSLGEAVMKDTSLREIIKFNRGSWYQRNDKNQAWVKVG